MNFYRWCWWKDFNVEQLVGLDNQGFPGGLVSKESTCNPGESRLSLGWDDSPEKEMATHSSILTESHGQRSLVGYSPRGFKSQTQRLYHHQIISKISQFMPLLSLHLVPTEIFFLERCFVKILLDLRKIARTVQSPFMSTPGFPLCYYLTSVWYLSQLMNQYPTELSNFFFFCKKFQLWL